MIGTNKSNTSIKVVYVFGNVFITELQSQKYVNLVTDENFEQLILQEPRLYLIKVTAGESFKGFHCSREKRHSM